jgi:GNAT superfamily N-acetyltransferase
MEQHIRSALRGDTDTVIGILEEAVLWLENQGMPMWRTEERDPGQIALDIEAGLFQLVEYEGQPAAIFKFQLEDALFWPDIPQGQSAFVHRLAVRRRYAGKGISSAILLWAASKARAMGRPYLRLDCDAARPRLRAVYERFGFKYHSDRQVGPIYVARYEFDVTKLAT